MASRPSSQQRPPFGPGQWAGWTPGAPLNGPAGGDKRRGFRLPLLPLLLVLLGVVILAEEPWLLFVGLGILLFAKMRRGHHRHGYHGSHHSGWHGGYGPRAR